MGNGKAVHDQSLQDMSETIDHRKQPRTHAPTHAAISSSLCFSYPADDAQVVRHGDTDSLKPSQTTRQVYQNSGYKAITSTTIPQQCESSR